MTEYKCSDYYGVVEKEKREKEYILNDEGYVLSIYSVH